MQIAAEIITQDVNYRYPASSSLARKYKSKIESEFVAIIGPNGSGKSTLANSSMAFFHRQGDIYIGGFNTKDKENIWEVRQNGMVSKSDNQIVTCRRNVALVGKLRYSPK